MFAPEGFIPFSKLAVDIFIKNQEISERLHGLLVSDFEFSKKERRDDIFSFSASRAKQYSFREVSELALFCVTRDVQKYVAHPDKKTFSFDLPILMNLEDYRSVYRSAEHYRGEYGSSGVSGDNYFDFGLDWRSFESEIDEHVKKSEDPWSMTFLKLPHTSINLFYERTSFIIDLDQARLLRSYGPYGLDMKSVGYPFNLNAIEPFEGYSICVKENDYNLETLQTQYETEVAKIVLSACWGDELTDELMENHNFAVSFPTAEGEYSAAIHQNIASEGQAVKLLTEHLNNNEFCGTLTDLRTSFQMNWARDSFVV